MMLDCFILHRARPMIDRMCATTERVKCETPCYGVWAVARERHARLCLSPYSGCRISASQSAVHRWQRTTWGRSHFLSRSTVERHRQRAGHESRIKWSEKTTGGRTPVQFGLWFISSALWSFVVDGPDDNLSPSRISACAENCHRTSQWGFTFLTLIYSSGASVARSVGVFGCQSVSSIGVW